MQCGLFFANARPFSVPVGYGSQYPYSKDGRMPGGEQAPIPDPILALAYAAASSQQTRT